MTQPTWPAPAFRAVGNGPDAPINTQVVVDCDDPHAQAAFWAAALGWVIEDSHDLVEAVLAAGFADRDRDTVEVDGRLAFRMGMGIRHPADVDAPRGTGRRILFQAVPDREPGKNKVHLDLNVGPERIDAEVARLTMLGAVEQYKVDEPGAFHTTMADPEGNLFCVQ